MKSLVCLLLFSLTLQLSSCREITFDPELPKPTGNGARGRDGKINFVLNFAEDIEDENDVTTLSASESAPETVVVQLEDGLSMVATLKRTTGKDNARAVNLRAFEHDARMHIVAYEELAGVETYVHHATFVVDIYAGGASNLIPEITRESPDGFSLYPGKNYRFIAYSYNTNSPMPISSAPVDFANLGPNVDLIWGKSAIIPVTGSGMTDVVIDMAHVFTKINLSAKIDAPGIISDIGGVKIAEYTANVPVKTGIPTVASPVIPRSEFSGLAPVYASATKDWTPRIVYTATDNPVIIYIDSVTINSTKKYKNLEAVFSRQLKLGYKYDLELKIQDTKDLDDNPHPSVNHYVGAFWKNSQAGERLIRIARPISTGTADGYWTAEVVSGKDWIRLDTYLPGGSENLWQASEPAFSGNDPVFETGARMLNGTAIHVNGTLNASNPYIFFRIGLAGTQPAGTAPRYGVVLLTYGNNTYRQRIFVRQGEEAADISSTGVTANFSPYNLAHFNLLIDYPTRFVYYPSQAGFYYQWGYHATITTPLPLPPIGTGTFGGGDPNPAYALGDACPPGYIVPTGSTGQQGTLDNPDIGGARGYYADGFFDRRLIVGSLNNPSEPLSTVSTYNNHIAYKGWIFFNKNNFASLFFPAAGYSDGNPKSTGEFGYYISSTSIDALYADMLGINFYNRFISSHKYTMAYSIRCVQSSLSVSPNSVWLAPSPPSTLTNSTKTVTVTSNGAWVIASQPANATATVTGSNTISIARSASVFGLSSFNVRNMATNEIATVSVDNYHLEDSKVLLLGNDYATGNTGTYTITVKGGSETFDIISWPTWVTSAIKLPNGDLQLVADQSPNGLERTGQLVLAHANDNSYQITYTVRQAYISLIPPFEYLVVKFTWLPWNPSQPSWGGSDMDFAAEFVNPTHPNPNILFANVPYSAGSSTHKAVGYGLSRAVQLDGTRITTTLTAQEISDNFTLLFHGSDAQGAEGETVFYKAPLITPANPENDVSGLPRYIDLDLYATWTNINNQSEYPGDPPGNPCRITVFTYSPGGVMLKPVGPDFSGTVSPNGPSWWVNTVTGVNNVNFYNVLPGTTGPQLAGNSGAQYLRPFDTRVSRVVRVDRNNPVQGQANFHTVSLKVATITYDRYTHSATVIWHQPVYSGPAVLPLPNH